MLADTVTRRMSESMYVWYVCAWRALHCTSSWLRRRAMLPNTKEREVLSHACQTYTWTHARTSAHTQILLCTPLGGEGPLVRQGKHRAASRGRLLVPPRQQLQHHPPCRRQPQQSHGAIAPATEHTRDQMMSPAHIYHIRFAMYVLQRYRHTRNNPRRVTALQAPSNCACVSACKHHTRMRTPVASIRGRTCASQRQEVPCWGWREPTRTLRSWVLGHRLS